VLLKLRKKGSEVCLFCLFYALFLSSSMPTMAIAMIMAIVATTKSITSGWITSFTFSGVGVAAGAGCPVTVMNDSANDG
jgi:hypothetical protein